MDEVALNMEPRDGFMDEFFAEVTIFSSIDSKRFIQLLKI